MEPSAANPNRGGLFGSIRSLLATSLSILRVRLELLATDVEEAKLRLIRLLVFTVLGLFLLCLGIVVAVFLVAAVFWDTHRIAVLCAIALALAAAGALLLFAAFRQATRYRFLSSTISELERDCRALEER